MFSQEIPTTVHGQEVPLVEVADAGIPATVSTNGTQAVDPLEGLFQREGVVVEVLAASAASLIR